MEHMMMAKSKRDYLFKRAGSDNFWIKLRPPPAA
jgi:hypothetical protein